jgi:DNA-binding response OmpR family regulator
MPALRILVVDADRSTAALAESALAPKGHEVAAAFDAASAQRILDRRAPDLLLLSPDLPDRDGYAFVRALRARPETSLIPIFFLADRRSAMDALQGFRNAADDFLPKPIDVRELEIRIHAALKRRQETERRFRTPPGGDEEDWTTRLTGMRGTLAQIGLPTVLGILDMERKSGVLVVAVDGYKSKFRLDLRGGRIVRATLDGAAAPRNAELVYTLLGHSKGRFDFRPCVVVADDEIRTSTATMLLEGARRLDEGKARRPF